MGLTPLITWAVIDPVMRAVITETQGFSVVETRASSLAFWMPTPNLARRGFWNSVKRGLRASHLEIAVMSRRGI